MFSLTKKVRPFVNPVRYLIVILPVPLLLALRSTDFKGYTDPDFIGYKAKTFVVCYANATTNFQMPFEKAFFSSLKRENWVLNGVMVYFLQPEIGVLIVSWVRC